MNRAKLPKGQDEIQSQWNHAFHSMEEAETKMLVALITPDYPQTNQEREEKNAYDLSFIT